MPNRNNKRKKMKNPLQTGESSKKSEVQNHQSAPCALPDTVENSGAKKEVLPNISLASTSTSSSNAETGCNLSSQTAKSTGIKKLKKSLPSWSPNLTTLKGEEVKDDMPSTENNTEKIDKKNFEEELKCTICSEIFINAVTLNCSHSFCEFCISKWRKDHTTCPICRQTITHQNLTLVLDKCAEQLLEGAKEDTKNRRKELIEYREKNKETNPPKICNNNANSPHWSNYDESDDDNFDDYSFEDYDNYSYSDGIIFDNDYEDEWNEDELEEEETDESDNDYDEEEDENEYDSYSDSGSYSEEEPNRSCYNCGQVGHMARNCPTGVSYNGIPGVYYGGYGSCFKCNSPGHWAKGCPY